jgi:hypothetical protein
LEVRLAGERKNGRRWTRYNGKDPISLKHRAGEGDDQQAPVTGFTSLGGQMKTPKCKPLLAAARYKRKAVRSLRYDGEALIVEIQGDGFAFARVVFERPAGFRLLDERDLCEFWDSYHQGNGWLYEVEEGGWMELESERPLFNSPSFHTGLREYLLVDDKCISVLSERPPEIQDVGADPGQVEAERLAER